MNPSSLENRKAIIVTGPVGAGKSTIMASLTDLLEEHGIPNAGVDMDHLRWFYPRQDGDPFGGEIGWKHLAYLVSSYRDLGINTLVIADVIEEEGDKSTLQSALDGYPIEVVRLKVPMELIAQRLSERESEENLQWYLNRAPELERIMEEAGVGDLIIEVGERPPRQIAEEIATKFKLIAPA